MKETKKLEADINTLQLKQEDLASILEQRQSNIYQLNAHSESKDTEIEGLNRMKSEVNLNFCLKTSKRANTNLYCV